MRKRTIFLIFIAIAVGLYLLKDMPPFNQVLAVGGAVSLTGYLKQLYDKIATYLQENQLAQTGLTTGVISGAVGLLVRRLGNIKLRQTTETLTNDIGTQFHQRVMSLANKVDTEVVQLTERVQVLETERNQLKTQLTDSSRDWDTEKTQFLSTIDSLKRQINERNAFIKVLQTPAEPPKID
jgi:hypothetical protein